jgi:hypothetical protein
LSRSRQPRPELLMRLVVGATLGATTTNNLAVFRTRMDNAQRLWPRSRTGLNGSECRYGNLQIRRLGCGGLEYPALLQDIDRPGDHEDSNDY